MCSHKRAEALYTESINTDCKFYSYTCSDVHNIKSGKCFHKHGQLGRLGFHADKALGRGKHMLETFDAQPYCGKFPLPSITITLISLNQLKIVAIFNHYYKMLQLYCLP